MSIRINNYGIIKIHTPYGWLSKITDSDNHVIWKRNEQIALDEHLCIAFVNENPNNYVHIRVLNHTNEVVPDVNFVIYYKSITDNSYYQTNTLGGYLNIPVSTRLFIKSQQYPTWQISGNTYHINIKCKQKIGSTINPDNDLDVPFILSGNIASLGGFDTLNITTLDYNKGYAGLFEDSSVYNARNLVLPFTTFEQSSGSCIGYQLMFKNCTLLTGAPDLLATLPPLSCYANLFYGCSNLNYIKCMMTAPFSGVTDDWVVGVSQTGTFVGKYGTQSAWSDCNPGDGIPTNWATQFIN